MSTVFYDRTPAGIHEAPQGIFAKKQKSYKSRQSVRKQPLSNNTRERTRPGHKGSEYSLRGFFTVLIIILSVALAFELVFHLFISQRLSIKHIHINAGEGIDMSEEYILSTAGISGKTNYFSVNPDTVSQKLSRIPAVREVTVERVFPDTLSITLVQREAVAAILIDTGDATVPALIDGEGVLFRVGTVETEGLPVLSGIRFESPKPGMVLPDLLLQFLGDIQRIKQTSPVLLTLISEFKFVKKDGSQYEVLLYPEHYRVPVRIGNRLDERTLNYVMMVLDVVLRQGLAPDLEEIDFRSGDVAFRTREG